MNSIKIFEQLVRLRGYTVLDSKTYLVFNPVNQTRIQFFLCNQEKLDMSYFYKAYEQLPENISHLVFIYNFATIQIKKLKMYKDILKIEFFHENELRRLLIGNRLIPKHTQVDSQTREQVIQTFGRDNLPMILHSDPMVRLHDFEMDSIVQIDRTDAVYYRLVVNED